MQKFLIIVLNYDIKTKSPRKPYHYGDMSLLILKGEERQDFLGCDNILSY